jgi:hypothetical protein
MTTRYGRTIKKPKEVYVPEHVELEDDYSEDEYDSDYSASSDILTEDEGCSDDDDEEEEFDEDDEDEGSLKDFVVSDSDTESDSESA